LLSICSLDDVPASTVAGKSVMSPMGLIDMNGVGAQRK
jgi:hypothetical protein